MSDEEAVPPPPKLRFTTGALMIWISAIAVAFGLLKGDLVEYLPHEFVWVVLAIVICGTVFGIPWLSFRLSRSPESLRPPSRASTNVANLLVIVILGLITSAVMLMAWFAYLISQAS